MTSSVLQFRMDVSVSVPLCKRALTALYTVANSSCSEPLVDSSAWKVSSVRFAGLEVHHSASSGSQTARPFSELTRMLLPRIPRASGVLVSVREGTRTVG